MISLIISIIILGILLLTSLFILSNFLKVLLPLLFWGAIYVPTKKEKIEKIIRLAEIKPEEKAVDLGSGDGNLVIALAGAGAEAHGYEVSPVLVCKSRKNIQKAGLEGKAFIHWGNFWRADLSEFDIVIVYGMKHVMKRLEEKLRKELRQDARIVSNNFKFPNWPQAREEDGICLYKNNRS